MNVHLISAALPPLFDGIGDYTSYLARELNGRAANVTVLTTADRPVGAMPGVRVAPTFSPRRRRSVWRIAQAAEAARPDWVVLQFNQFSYGRWGLNPFLPRAMARIKRTCPGTRIAVMFHEDFVPAVNWRWALLRIGQRWQFRSLGRTADVVFFSIDPWVVRYGPWFAGKPVIHLPVGSNVPLDRISREDARGRLGIPAGRLVLGLFGGINEVRNLPWVRAALDAARAGGRDVGLLYVGADAERARAAAGGLPVIAAGPLAGDEVSRRLQAVDVYLAPFNDGVSTRRGSMMAGLQHGLPTVGTSGPLTDRLLEGENGKSMLLAPVERPVEFGRKVAALLDDAALRRRMGGAAAALYEDVFDWPRIAARMLAAMGAADASRASSGVSRYAMIPQEGAALELATREGNDDLS